MAKIKNTGNAPRGFIDDQGAQVTVPPGGEAEVNLTEADYDNLVELLKKEKETQENDPNAPKDKPPSFEISGGAGGKAQTSTVSATGNRVENPKADEKPKR